MFIRPMTGEDELMPFLVAAMDWRNHNAWTPESILAAPDIAHYITGWLRPGDFGLIAEIDGIPAGAAWWRTFTSDDPGYGYVADDVPEIGLAVLAGWRGLGYGSLLLTEICEHARDAGVRGLSLSVEDGNDGARRLYERTGFAVCGREGNSDTMVLRLA
ncbi:N-acetyltransferase family protein [Demequina sp.]|uniref:GNAT family N-acetyltransferase n=1 Tax=Demequina sp. TaxID=2050685 RepID=UPI003D0989AD